MDSLAATSSFPPATFSVDFLREALLEYLFAINHHHHHGLGGGRGGDGLVTTILPCRRLAVRPKMSGLRPHDWTWRLAAAVANLYSIVSVSICLFVSSVIVIIECHCHY